MIRRLRFRLTALLMGTCTLLLLILFSLIFGLTRQRLMQEDREILERAAELPLRGPEEKGDPSRLPAVRVLVDEDGTILKRSGADYYYVSEEDLSRLIRLALSKKESFGSLEKGKIHYLRRAVGEDARSGREGHEEEDAGEERGEEEENEEEEERLIVFSDFSASLRSLNALLRNCILIGLFALLFFFLLSFSFVQRAVRPVETAFESQRRFVSAASHELKTPLSVILSNAELLQRRIEEYSPSGEDSGKRKELRHFSENILSTSRQMRALTENLLELARMDGEDARLSGFETLDFSMLASEEALRFEVLFFESGRILCSEIREGIFVLGAPVRLRQVLDILLDNAKKYGSPGGEVRLRLGVEGKKLLLCVDSPGKELSPKDCEKIFRRFYRVDESRGSGGGYGLGLPIAEKIIEFHRGRIWAESGNGRNRFFVELPRSESVLR